ncbi:MAG: hypothetical protein ACUVTU_05895 [Desulfurispora sp.]|uniref:hypothetical protein n=1 Tax=Desulfurispora sp. TaxID=3014275 RepID=UPI0040499CF2
MQITQLVPALLRILGQRAPTPPDKSPPGQQDFARVMAQDTPAAAASRTAAEPVLSRQDTAPTPDTSGQTAWPGYFPLPWRSELFPRASFYIKFNERDAGAKDPATASSLGLFIQLQTSQLGYLWLYWLVENQHCLLQLYTPDKEVARLLQERLSELEALLHHSYPESQVICHYRPDVHTARQLIPELQNLPRAILIDLTV